MLDLFEIVAGQVVVRMPVVMFVTEFHALMYRKVGMDSDHDGRKKKLNTLELAFVVCMADDLLSNNLYSGFLPKERAEKIKNDIGLPDGWKPDEKVKAAIEKYIDIQRTYVPSAAALASIERGIKLAGAAVDSYIEQLYTSLQDAKDILKGGTLSEVDKAALALKNDAIYTSVKRINELAKGLPQSIKSINELRSEVSKEQRDMHKKIGNKSIGRYERPDLNVV